MTNDANIPANIVKHMRMAANDQDCGIGTAWSLLEISADEIERLRAALTEISQLKAEDMYRGDDDNQAAFLARAALEPTPGRKTG
jgi:hypothetical protein